MMSDLLPTERPLPPLPPVMPWWVMPSLGGAVLAIFAGGVMGVFIIGDSTNLTSMIQAIINATLLVLGYCLAHRPAARRKTTRWRASASTPATNGRQP
jgi:hypothetical protein